MAEADVYHGYGKVKIWDYSPGDFDRDGDVDATDQTTFNAALIAGGSNKSTPDPMSDLDYDGDTDLTDAAAFTTIKNAGGAVAQRYVSPIGNPFFFTGRRLYMLETLPEGASVIQANQQLQHNRARHCSPMEGRWLQRDPMGYVDGPNSYQFTNSQPNSFVDPTGASWYVDSMNRVFDEQVENPRIRGSKTYGLDITYLIVEIGHLYVKMEIDAIKQCGRSGSARAEAYASFFGHSFLWEKRNSASDHKLVSYECDRRTGIWKVTEGGVPGGGNIVKREGVASAEVVVTATPRGVSGDASALDVKVCARAALSSSITQSVKVGARHPGGGIEVGWTWEMMNGVVLQPPCQGVTVMCRKYCGSCMQPRNSR